MHQQAGPPAPHPTSACRPSPKGQQGALCRTLDKVSQTCLTTSTSSSTLRVLPSLWWGQRSPRASSVQFSSVQSLSHVRLCDPMNHSMPGLPVHHQSLLKPMSIESVMPSNHLILRRPLLFLPSIYPSIRVFSFFLLLFLNINLF